MNIIPSGPDMQKPLSPANCGMLVDGEAPVMPVSSDPLPTKYPATTFPTALICPAVVSVVTFAFTPMIFPNMSKVALFIVVLDMGCAR
jgi:hypothetical protein